MNRRTFFQALCAIAGISAVAKEHRRSVVKPNTWYPYSIAELLSLGVEVESVGISLCDLSMSVEGIPINCHAALSSRVYYEDVPASCIFGTLNAMNVCLHGNWLDCDDVSFYSVAGGHAGLMVHFNFTNGAKPILTFLRDSRVFSGLPIFLNGGNVHVVMPNEGLVRLA